MAGSQQPARGHKWFAAFWDWMVKMESPLERRVRAETVGGAEGRVLEIGCGVGANFPFYDDALDDIIAIDPDPFMLERARRRLQELRELGRSIEVRQARAEDLPFPDASFDTVVSTLNMCTIADPLQALAEVRRVLKPDGQYRFFDHVRYQNAFGAFWQDLVTPVWRWVGAGCHPNRDVARLVRQAGFRLERLEQFTPVPPIPPMVFARPHVKGVARPA